LAIIRWFILITFTCVGLSACDRGTDIESATKALKQTGSFHPADSTQLESSNSDRGKTPTYVAPTQTKTVTIDAPLESPSPSPSPLKFPASNSRTTSPPVPTSTATAIPCISTSGHFESGSLDTKLLRLPLEYRVYLPPCYEQGGDQRYPVLYLFHGQGFTDEQWDRIGADETADRLVISGEIPPLIIVMPYDRYGGQPTESNFAQAVVEVLVPKIDQTFRTIPDRDHRAVGGLSRGGGWAIHLALVYWQVFGALGGHSPAVFFTDAQDMRSFLDEIPVEKYPRIYLDIGDRDRPEILRAAIWFEQLLDTDNIPHEWHLFSGYHNEAYWTAHMAQYLHWYSLGW
jgi:enterochelin esterase-like enzyme